MIFMLLALAVVVGAVLGWMLHEYAEDPVPPDWVIFVMLLLAPFVFLYDEINSRHRRRHRHTCAICGPVKGPCPHSY